MDFRTALENERRKAQIAAQNQAKQAALDNYNDTKAKLDNKYQNSGGLGAFLGGIAKGIGDIGKGTFDLIGTGGAAIADLVTGNAGTMKNQKEFKQWLYNTDDVKDAYAKSAGTALNAATNLATTALPGLSAGSVAGKALAGTAANTAAGAIGGVADELQEQGADARLDNALKRATSGAVAGLAAGKLGSKIGNANSKVGSALLNNRVATSTLGRGALAGAIGGATGAGTAAALEGDDILGASLGGGLTGALAGGTQAGVMSAANNIAQRAKNRIAGNNSTQTQALQPVETSDVIETGTTQTIPVNENIATNRQIAEAPNSELSTSVSGQLRKKSAEALLDQYGTISKPMAKSANALDSVQKVANAGFEKPADVERMINAITGDSGKVTKLTRKLVATAQPVNTFDGMNELIEQQIALNGLTDTDAKSVRNMLEAQLNRLPSRQNGTLNGLDEATDVFDIVKALEKRSANLKGKSGSNYSTTTPERTDKAKVLDNIANVLKDRIYEGAAPMDAILTKDVRDDLISLAPKNKKWADYVDNTIMKAQDIGELRSTVAPFVNMGKVIDDQYMNYGTYGQKVGDAAQAAGKAAQSLFKMPFIGQVAEAAANSNAVKRLQSKAYAEAANIAANKKVLQARDAVTGTGNTQPITENSNNLLGNFIGRTQGQIAGGDIVNNGVKQVEYQNLNDMLAAANSIPTGSVMTQNSINSNPMASQITDISNAMQLALQAGDFTAYNQLANLYDTAYGVYKQQMALNGATEQGSNLSTAEKNQIAKLESAGNALDELEALYSKAGGGQGIIGGNLANFLGGLGLNADVNTYNQLAQGLINQIGAAIGKTDSLNTEGEVQRALSLVPKITDDAQTAQNKLASLRSLLATNTETYNSLYGA